MQSSRNSKRIGLVSLIIATILLASCPAPLPLLDVPGNLLVTARDGEVMLSWNGVPVARSYHVYRDGTLITTDTIITDTTYIDSTVTNGTTYTYVVRAVNASLRESPNSLSVTANPFVPPDTPDNLQVTGRSGEVTLTWDAVAGATSYRVYRNGERVVPATVITALTYVDRNVTNEITYDYTVRAVNASLHASSYSTAISATPPPLPTGEFDTLAVAGNDNPTGLWSDGITMWVVDATDDKIYAYNMATKMRDGDKDFNILAPGNNRPAAIWSDGTTMWVLNSALIIRIYAYNMETKLYDSTQNFNTLVAAGNNHPAGIWSDGITMWVSDVVTGRIYAYSLESKMRDGAKDFNTLAAGHTEPTGIWSDGTTMWGLDASDDKLYAYNLESGAYEMSRDIGTLLPAGNDEPFGLWSNTVTIWVSDQADDRIYAYDLATGVHSPGP